VFVSDRVRDLLGWNPDEVLGRPFREFIERVVALAPQAFVLAVAGGQVLVGLGLVVGRGLPLAGGAAGAAFFLVAISWLGVGAAFPLNLVLAAGALLLLRERSAG